MTSAYTLVPYRN